MNSAKVIQSLERSLCHFSQLSNIRTFLYKIPFIINAYLYKAQKTCGVLKTPQG